MLVFGEDGGFRVETYSRSAAFELPRRRKKVSVLLRLLLLGTFAV